MRHAVFFLLGIATVIGAASYPFRGWLPTKQDIKGCMITAMYHVELCPTSKNYVPLQKISQTLQKTIVLTEDSNFFNHKGFDWESIEKNAREGWAKGVFKRGGSTITQQLAKNMFLSKERTFIRKSYEALITDRIESTLSKKEILERYLNIVEFGKDLYGVSAAANYYFQKPPSELNVVESAFLAMILPNPVKYSKSYYKKELTPFALRRLTEIIESLYRYSRISQQEYELAIAQVPSFFQKELNTDENIVSPDSENINSPNPSTPQNSDENDEESEGSIL
ncbi:MAG: transglycosylase domain-containing protein [Pseudobdellovibrionaceae bacterium]